MDKNIKILFDTYNKKLKQLEELLQDESLPRNLRLFDIRLRLAIDIVIDFKGDVSLTKTQKVKETYILLIKLIEFWNVYEVLCHYAKEENNKYAKNKTALYKSYSQAFLTEVGSLAILKETLDSIKLRYTENKNFKKDFEKLIEKIEKDERIVGNLTTSCKNVLEYCIGNKNISGIEIIALVYAERNMYYHNGEAAKMGMDYENRQYLIQTLTTGFLKHILLLITKILEKECDKVK